MSTHDILHRLSETLASRRNADPEKSYTAKLFSEGPDSILKKIGEECAELIMAGKEGKRLKVVWESTDVIFHIMVLLTHYGLTFEDILQELREKTVVAVNASGQVREFQLRIRVKFKMRTPQGVELISPTEIVQQRDISFNESAVLAKEAEEVLLYRDMQTDIVQQLLRRIAAVKTLTP